VALAGCEKNGMVIKENYLYLPTAMKFTFHTTI
jgi:hypothetical protein